VGRGRCWRWQYQGRVELFLPRRREAKGRTCKQLGAHELEENGLEVLVVHELDRKLLVALAPCERENCMWRRCPQWARIVVVYLDQDLGFRV
jgi:hypothetical protein